MPRINKTLLIISRPYKEIIFRPIKGTWQDVAGESGTLAETLERHGLIIDDNCEFARIKKTVFHIGTERLL